MKLNIALIVQMPGKMHAALNQFFTRRHEDDEAKLSRKFGHFRKNDFLYLRFYNCEPFEGESSGANHKCLQCLPQ